MASLKSIGSSVGSKQRNPTSDSEAPQALSRLESQDAINPTENFRESDAGDGSKREEQYLTGLKLWTCLISVMICLFLVALDQTIVVTLLTEVGNQFNAFSKIGWITAGFLLAVTVTTIIWGKLSIIFGRKYGMYVSIVLFEAGSLMCALSQNMNTLIGGRVLAGIGGGGIQSLVFVIISEIVPIHSTGSWTKLNRSTTMALVSIVFLVASVLGPIIGGAFTSHVTWRWCFYINLPIGGLAAVLFGFAFNPPKPTGNLREKIMKIDFIGIFLMTGGIVVFLLALAFGASDYRWDSAAVISCFVIGGVACMVFAYYNYRYSKNQVIPVDVVVIPQNVASVLTVFGIYGVFMSALLYLSIYFQVIFNASAMSSGVHILPIVIPVILSSVIVAVIINKTHFVKPFVVLGSILCPVGCGLLCLFKVDSSNSARIGIPIILGVSIGLVMQPSFLTAQISAPKTPGGTIMTTTFVNFAKSLGGTIAADLADAVYSSAFQNSYHKHIGNASATIVKELSGVDASTFVDSTSIIQTLGHDAQMFVKQRVMDGILNVFYMQLGFAGLTLISSLFVTNHRLPKHEAPREDAKDAAEGDRALSGDESTVSVEQSEKGAQGNSDDGANTADQVKV